MAAETPPALQESAPAKINLTLHVLGRRADGYHALESLVTFADVADALELAPGPGLLLDVLGPTGPASGPPEQNIVLKAARELSQRVEGLALGRFRLTKRLPAAAGIGGGSSDAAAALRLLARLNGLAGDDPRLLEAARATGADVPVCFAGGTRMMRGAGEVLGPALAMPQLHAILVNPGVGVETPAVFRALALEPGAAKAGAPHPAIDASDPESLFAALAAGRNDLEPAAIALQPVIGDALDQLARLEGCRLARMSGSGATCFGLFEGAGPLIAALGALRRRRPGWWIHPAMLAG